MSDPQSSPSEENGTVDDATRRRGRRMLVALALIGVLAAVGMLAGRILQAPARGDVVVTSVISMQDESGAWRSVAVWTRPTDDNGCVVLPWKVERSDRGFEVRSQLLAPSDTAFPAICQSTGTAVLETTQYDPVGRTLAVNGTSFVVVRGEMPTGTVDAP